jgi:hypothetical protein
MKGSLNQTNSQKTELEVENEHDLKKTEEEDILEQLNILADIIVAILLNEN